MPVRVFILILFIAATTSVQAADLWLHVTGIDDKNTSQNYDAFYKNHLAFVDVCKSKPGRVCRALINPDPKLMPGKYPIDPKSSTPTRAGVLSDIDTLLSAAGPGDRVVISLSNHGSPIPGYSPSCIYMGGDVVCEADLKKLIGDRPKKYGFQIAIMADGCYSGGFQSLASPDVCVLTTADQYHIGGVSQGVWSRLKERPSPTLASLSHSFSGVEFRTTSQYIRHEECAAVREKIGGDMNIEFLVLGSNLNRLRAEVACPNPSIKVNPVSELYDAVKGFAPDQFAQREKYLMERICTGDTPDICAKAKNLVAKLKEAGRLARFSAVLKDGEAIEAELEQANDKALAGLSNEQQSDFYHIYYNMDDGRYNAERIAKFTATEIEDMKSRSRALQAETNRLNIKLNGTLKPLEDFFKGQDEIYKEFNELNDCLTKPPQGDSEYWDPIAKEFPPIKFSPQQKEEAQKCEQNFQF